MLIPPKVLLNIPGLSYFSGRVEIRLSGFTSAPLPLYALVSTSESRGNTNLFPWLQEDTLLSTTSS